MTPSSIIDIIYKNANVIRKSPQLASELFTEAAKGHVDRFVSGASSTGDTLVNLLLLAPILGITGTALLSLYRDITTSKEFEVRGFKPHESGLALGLVRPSMELKIKNRSKKIDKTEKTSAVKYSVLGFSVPPIKPPTTGQIVDLLFDPKSVIILGLAFLPMLRSSSSTLSNYIAKMDVKRLSKEVAKLQAEYEKSLDLILSEAGLERISDIPQQSKKKKAEFTKYNIKQAQTAVNPLSLISVLVGLGFLKMMLGTVLSFSTAFSEAQQLREPNAEEVKTVSKRLAITSPPILRVTLVSSEAEDEPLKVKDRERDKKKEDELSEFYTPIEKYMKKLIQ